MEIRFYNITACVIREEDIKDVVHGYQVNVDEGLECIQKNLLSILKNGFVKAGKTSFRSRRTSILNWVPEFDLFIHFV